MSSKVLEVVKKSCYAAVKNKDHILNVLKDRVETLQKSHEAGIKLLEIASGTGEHAAHFLDNIPSIAKYQPTDIDSSMHDSIRAWTEPFSSRVYPPFAFDMLQIDTGMGELPPDYTSDLVDVMVCINMIHISPFACTRGLMNLAGRILNENGFLLTYGAYRVNGEMVESNVKFDESLKARNPEWGVRDLELVEEAANANGLILIEVVPMPSNNLCLIFSKQ